MRKTRWAQIAPTVPVSLCPLLKNRGRKSGSEESMNNSNGFKMTEIGQLPEDWEVRRLGDMANQRKESITPVGDGKTKYVGLEHIDSGRSRLQRYGFDNEVKSTKFKFFKDDILYGKLRPYLDKCILSDLEGVCSTDIIVIKTSNQIDCK